MATVMEEDRKVLMYACIGLEKGVYVSWSMVFSAY